MNHAKNGTVGTSIKNSIFDLIFIGFSVCYPLTHRSSVSAYVTKRATTSNFKIKEWTFDPVFWFYKRGKTLVQGQAQKIWDLYRFFHEIRDIGSLPSLDCMLLLSPLDRTDFLLLLLHSNVTLSQFKGSIKEVRLDNKQAFPTTLKSPVRHKNV